MRLSELLGAEVRDANGRVIGRVQDVRVVQSGPETGGGIGKTFRIETLLVGRNAAGRIGLSRPGMSGPAWFSSLVRLFERHLREIEWPQVEAVNPGLVQVRLTD